MTQERRDALKALCVAALGLTACELSGGDPMLPAAAQTIRRERTGEDPDRDLLEWAPVHANGHHAWTAAGFEEATFGWRLPFQNPAQRQLLGPAWRTVNWKEVSPGRWEPKNDPAYVGVDAVDDNGDGKIGGWEKRNDLLFDVELVNEEDDDVVWIKTKALSPQEARRKLELVANGYVHALSGTNTFGHMDIFGHQRERTRTMRSIVRSVRESRVGLHRALRVVADLVDADDRVRLGQLRLVVARVGYFVKRASPAETSLWPLIQRDGQSYWKKTAVLVLGSVTAPDDPAKTSPIDGLAGRLTFTEASAVIEAPRPSEAEPSRVDAPDTTAI